MAALRKDIVQLAIPLNSERLMKAYLRPLVVQNFFGGETAPPSLGYYEDGQQVPPWLPQGCDDNSMRSIIPVLVYHPLLDPLLVLRCTG